MGRRIAWIMSWKFRSADWKAEGAIKWQMRVINTANRNRGGVSAPPPGLPARFWELGAGSLLVLGLVLVVPIQKTENISFFVEVEPFPQLPGLTEHRRGALALWLWRVAGRNPGCGMGCHPAFRWAYGDVHILPHSLTRPSPPCMFACQLQSSNPFVLRTASAYESQCSKLTMPPAIAIQSSHGLVAICAWGGSV
jgi:hypothetical protein